MATASNALTLAAVAKQETQVLRKGILMNLLRAAPILELVPFQTVSSLQNVAVRWENLPSMAWRSINEGYTPNHGSTEQVWEAVYALGGEIEMDRVWGLVNNYVEDPRVTQVKMKTKAAAFEFADVFINGDHATDAKQFEGLKKRVASMPARQSVYFAGSASAALDPTASIGNARDFITKLEEVCWKTNGGNVQALLMNEAMKWGVARVMRYAQTTAGAGVMDVTKDSFDREIPTFRGAAMIDVGLKKDQSTEIIPDNETAGDAGTDATSIYGVSFNGDGALSGIQLRPMEVFEANAGGERETLPTNITRFEWWVGLSEFGSYCTTRGQNVEGASNWT